jgi:hypothetical protein
MTVEEEKRRVFIPGDKVMRTSCTLKAPRNGASVAILIYPAISTTWLITVFRRRMTSGETSDSSGLPAGERLELSRHY